MRSLRLIIIVVVLVLASSTTFLTILNAQLQNIAKVHFVLVHGLGHGAWCWYKVATILKGFGFEVTTIDMASNGIDKTNADTITTTIEYVKPLMNFVGNLTSEKVILVGHSLGGIAITLASEEYPSKIAKAIYVAALMPKDNQSASEILSEAVLNEIMSSGVLIPNFVDRVNPTRITSLSIGTNVEGIKTLFYNLSPKQDITLALSLLASTPFAPLADTIFLTSANYGSVCRFYIGAKQDHAIPSSVQNTMITENPPEDTFYFDDSDHSPFFSVPVKLAFHLAYIAAL